MGEWLNPVGMSRRLVGAAAAGMASAAVALAVAGVATAEPPPGDSCSPAAILQKKADTMTQLADFLNAHPDVNGALGAAWAKSTPEERRNAVNDFLGGRPDVDAAQQGIHQPANDLSASCGLPADMDLRNGS